MVSVHDRPPEVEERLIPGHWEGDLINGAQNRSAVWTLVEHTTLFTVLSRMDNASAEAALSGFSHVLNRIEAQRRLSLTYDQGREMAAHHRLTEATGVKVYFADPHSPWQRGINENTNGLLRQYLPKGSDLSGFSQGELDAIAWKLNTGHANRWASDVPQSCSLRTRSISGSIMLRFLHLVIETAHVFDTGGQLQYK